MIEQVNHVHTQTPAPTKVGLKLTQSTQGVSLEVDVDRWRQTGETDDEAIYQAGRVLAAAFAEGQERAAALGLTLGKAAPK